MTAIQGRNGIHTTIPNQSYGISNQDDANQAPEVGATKQDSEIYNFIAGLKLLQANPHQMETDFFQKLYPAVEGALARAVLQKTALTLLNGEGVKLACRPRVHDVPNGGRVIFSHIPVSRRPLAS